MAGAAGAGVSAATIADIGNLINKLDLPDGVKKGLIAAAGTAVGAAVGGAQGAAGGFNQTANNYLKHDDAAAMKKEVANCQAKAGGCKDGEVTNIVAKYKAISDANIAAIESCIAAGNVQCVQDNLKQAASASEVKVLPFGYTKLEDTFVGRQDNVNTYGSVRGNAALFGSDVDQARDVAKFRQENCSSLSASACDGLVKQAMDYRLGRMAILTATGSATALAVNAVKGLKLPPKAEGPTPVTEKPATTATAQEIAALERIKNNANGPDLTNKAPNSVLNQQAVKDLQNGTLPGTPIDPAKPWAPREMTPTSNPSATAEDFSVQILGRQPTAAERAKGEAMFPNKGGCPGCWIGTSADGTVITYRPAGLASDSTLSTTASVDLNNKVTLNNFNLDKKGNPSEIKLKFPLTGKTGVTQ